MEKFYEFIKAAILIRIHGKDEIFTGKRHHLIIEDIHNKGLTEEYKRFHVDGFMVKYKGNGEFFINRNTATDIAKQQDINMRGNVLTSEDLW